MSSKGTEPTPPISTSGSSSSSAGSAASLRDENDNNNDNDKADNMGNPKTLQRSQSSMPPPREPFFAFVPQVLMWFGGIFASEAAIVKNAAINGPSWFQSYTTDSFQFYKENPRTLLNEVISGFTVAIMQVPESIAFSIVAGVPPLSGLQATFWMAFITGIFGGKPGMISGAAGALAVVVADLTDDGGPLSYLTPSQRVNALFMTMFLCGVIQIGFAVLRLAKFVRLLPETALIGYMNGLAIIIFIAELPSFQYCDAESIIIDCTEDQKQWLTFQDDTVKTILTVSQVFLCMIIMKYFHLIPVVGDSVPSSLVALLTGTVLEHTLFRLVIGTGTRTVDETAPISGSIPAFEFPSVPMQSDTLMTIIQYAFTVAIIGSLESILTLKACHEITDTVPQVSESNQELFAQGLGNLLSGLSRAMGGDAMMGQSTINLLNGGGRRVSSTICGVFMLLFIVALGPLINLIPIATLTGVLFMVVLSTFQWKTFMILRYGRITDSVAIILVTVMAVFYNVAIAIGVGVVFSAIVHAYDSGNHVEGDVVLKTMIVNGTEKDVKYVHVKGAIFFSSIHKLINLCSPNEGPSTVILDFEDAIIVDHSAVVGIQGIVHRYETVGKQALLVNLPCSSCLMMQRTGDSDSLRKDLKRKHVLADLMSGEFDEESPSILSIADHMSVEFEIPGEVEIPHAESGEVAAPFECTGLMDETRVGGQLKCLKMFELGVHPINVELAQLGQNQPRLSIVEKDGGTTTPRLSRKMTSFLEDVEEEK
eukprot:CAMPEP_0119549120 /NCGR_PEP_ID=MMETSP1352-20130426/2895_1 /TAXON_ID=265584 /ORGANISM="Stauroneis constricta, Strain CCMP1120" /LENGTH=763 /DNA_ID=CAMNT_0007594591 /DNA_START=117 /DNA_END=2408 /DNA_ORIENTATION=+